MSLYVRRDLLIIKKWTCMKEIDAVERPFWMWMFSFFIFMLYNLVKSSMCAIYNNFHICLKILEMEFSNWFWKSCRETDFFVCVWTPLLKMDKRCYLPISFSVQLSDIRKDENLQAKFHK